MSQQQQSPNDWNNHFHRDRAYDATYNAPMEEPARSYYPYKQGQSDIEKGGQTRNNPEDPSFWQTPGGEQASVMPSAPPPESLYDSNSGRGLESDEEFARRIYREEQEEYMRYSQGSMSQPINTGGSYPRSKSESFYGARSPVGVQGPPPTDTDSNSKVPKAYFDPNIQRQLQKKKTWRPYFTYLVTLIQTVLLIYEFVYNQKETGSVIQTKPFNPLIGPSTSPTLIRLGARFVPCMRPIPTIDYKSALFQCPNHSLPDISKGTCNLEALCGLGGFSNGVPNQWFRFITPIFLHGGIIHFLLNMLFQIQTGRQIEADIGPIRYGIIYMASGIFGFIFGGNFSSPTLPSLGASGSLFGIIGVLLLDLLQKWKLYRNPCTELTKLLLMIIFTFLLGLLPGIDNFSHIGGFVMGILTGLVLVPTIDFSKIHKRFNWSLRVVFLPIVVLLFFLLIRNFYVQSDPANTCRWCKYLSCLPVAGWCDASGIQNTTTTP